MENQEKVKNLIDLRVQAKLGGGAKRIASQHARTSAGISDIVYAHQWCGIENDPNKTRKS